jgi:DNA-binding transcriptional regulator YiaG
MTGTAFRRFRQELPCSLRDLADRWGCSKQNIQNKEQQEEVTQIYADAMRTLIRKHRDNAPF